MCYIRGQPNDYDRWAEKAGDEKFKYENVLPVFKEQQQAVGYGSDEFNGRSGFLKTALVDMSNTNYADLCNAFMKGFETLNSYFRTFEFKKLNNQKETAVREAGKQAGYPENEDANGPTQEGFGYYASTSYKGTSMSKIWLAK